MNIKKLNLNLLVTLHVLLQERNVTLASKALFITQPAVSLALKQLRIDFDDQLLIQNNKEKRMMLTNKAQQLKPQLESMIDSMQKIMNFNINILYPEQLHGEYRIALHSCISSLILPQLYTLLKEKAPNIRLSLENITDINSISIKDQEKFDFFIGAFSNVPKIYHREVFLEENFVCLSGINELNQESSLTKIALCQYEHVILSYMNNYPETIIDIMLYKNGVTRKHYITVSDVFCAAQLAYEKELLLILPEKYAYSLLPFFPLKLFQLPFVSQKCFFELLYRNISYSSTHQWLKKKILDFLQNISL